MEVRAFLCTFIFLSYFICSVLSTSVCHLVCLHFRPHRMRPIATDVAWFCTTMCLLVTKRKLFRSLATAMRPVAASTVAACYYFFYSVTCVSYVICAFFRK